MTKIKFESIEPDAQHLNRLLEESLFEDIVEQLLHKGYASADLFLNREEASAILAASQAAYDDEGFQLAGIGKGAQFQKNRAIRRDQILWLDHRAPREPNRPFFDRLSRLIDYLNRTCFMGIRDMEFHFAIYPEGAYYKRHLDVFTTDSSRKLSAICYLNPNWQAADGGQLRLFLPEADGTETNVEILPEAGRLVLFDSQTLEHEVMPTTRERYSITGWLKDQKEMF
jgi:SM-20-related protein